MTLDPKKLGQQLRHPQGELGLRVADGMQQSNQRLLQNCLTALQLTGTDYLLELGPGNGAHVPAMLPVGARYLGLDNSADMVQAAQAQASGQWHFVQGDLHELPYQEQFTALLSLNTCYFWQDLLGVSARLFTALQPAGRLVLGLRSRASMATQPQFAGYRLFDGPELADGLHKTGFTDITVTPHDDDALTIAGHHFAMSSLVIKAQKPG